MERSGAARPRALVQGVRAGFFDRQGHWPARSTAEGSDALQRRHKVARSHAAKKGPGRGAWAGGVAPLARTSGRWRVWSSVEMQLRVRLRVHEGVGLCSQKKSAVKHSIHVK